MPGLIESNTMTKPLVSIACVTYNHEKFISKAIEGFLLQKTDFSFEILIGDDSSTDDTKQIIEEFEKKHPHKIRIVSSKRNIGSLENNIKVISSSKGKYIAFCDGDDYWTDQFKLQKQVDFLEANSEYVMTYSDISLVDVNGLPIDDLDTYADQKKYYKDGEIFWDLFKNSFINTNTTCVRSENVLTLLDYVKKHKKDRRYIYDYWLWLHIAREGKVKYIKDEMVAYRIHDQSISRKSYFEKRWPLVKLDVAFSLNKNEAKTVKNKNFVTNILLMSILNKNVDFGLKVRALTHLLKFPPTPSYIAEKIKKKFTKKSFSQ